MNIIQFLPYYPPDKWWLESHAQEWASAWEQKWFWSVLNVVLWNKSWKQQKNKDVLYLPSIELIYNFPFPKFWTEEYKIQMKKVENFYNQSKEKCIIQTRTRFFISSFIWWRFAKKVWADWVHIEHGSSYVKLSNIFKNMIAYLFDKTIGKWIICKANLIIWVSAWCRNFIYNSLCKRRVEVIYRWANLNFQVQRSHVDTRVRLGFIWRLISNKWLHYLLQSIYSIKQKNKYNFNLTIIGDWEERQNLENQARKLRLTWIITFEWEKERSEIYHHYLPNIDILINPSLSEGLPTSVIEWLYAKCTVVATDVWWTSEISDKEDLILCKPWDIVDLEHKIIHAIKVLNRVKWLSRQTVLEKFSWDTNILTYYKLYNNNLWKR